MTNIDIARGIIFQHLGISTRTAEDKQIAHKKIYLLQALGTDLGFEYNWYTKGPYSPTLVDYLATHLDCLLATDFTKHQLKPKAQSNINIVNNLGKARTKTSLSLASWYELLASLVYLKQDSLPPFTLEQSKLACKVIGNCHWHTNIDI